jgi:hypothetical protein
MTAPRARTPVTVIGLDCAVDPRRRGVARAAWDGRHVTVDHLARGDRCDLTALVGAALAHGPVLLALDAPLGWPAALGPALADHRAGAPLRSPADDLFRRHTDRVVARRLGKTPLDVGADRIARTARAALGELDQLARGLGRRRPIPLLWQPTRPPRLAAVEVYPAGLLVAANCPVRSGYKPAAAHRSRAAILAHLAGDLVLDPPVASLAQAHADLLDAALCALAGADVLAGRCPAPGGARERATARREGWIWVREAGR